MLEVPPCNRRPRTHGRSSVRNCVLLVTYETCRAIPILHLGLAVGQFSDRPCVFLSDLFVGMGEKGVLFVCGTLRAKGKIMFQLEK